VRSREIGGFVFSEAVYRARSRTLGHVHDLAGVAVVLEGGFEKRMHRSDYQCVPGTLTLEPPGVTHAELYGGKDVRALLIEILPSRLAAITAFVPALPLTVSPAHPFAARLAARAALELRTPDFTSPLILEGLALELVGAATRSGVGDPLDTTPLWLRLVLERLRDDFRSDVQLDSLAAAAGVHPTHLTRAFRAYQGCTVGEFVRRRRIEWAAVQLASTTVPIATLALSAGFYDQSHFTRVFTERMGVSPGRYRALNQPRRRGKSP